MVVMVVVPLPLALALHHTWPGQGLRLEGSLGMLLVRSRIPSPPDVELDGTDFPMLRQMLFHAPLSQQLCLPKQGLRKKVRAGVCASAVEKHRPDVGKASPCVCALRNKKSSKGMRNLVCQIANMEANTRKSEPLLSCRQHVPHRRGLWS